MGKVKPERHTRSAKRGTPGTAVAAAEPDRADEREASQREAIAAVTPAQALRELENIVRALRQLEERAVVALSALKQRARPQLLRSVEHASDGPVPRLTRRESETLALYAQGVSFEDIARIQGVKLSTVREQTKSARAKLEVTTTAQAAAKARRLGLIP
ncbi:MAG TPA: LuxR C-terminal-related transcriptional regulator [Ktedonobacterales bacterium]|nr:LuxR C-terminal-related transcriptional regulator [Ktedonobacterales bacterium]